MNEPLPTKAEEFAIPKGLSAKGRKAAQAILKVLKKYDAADSGGCTVFYTPARWKERGEDYGTESLLVVVYDGGDHRQFFNMDCERYKLHEEMRQALHEVGCYPEECTGWYCAIYPC